MNGSAKLIGKRADSAHAARGTLAIVVGGGPAPGINGVISAATIEARNRGCRVIGVMDGFSWLGNGDIEHVEELEIEAVSRIHLQGGSLLRTSRANPTKSETLMSNVLEGLSRLGVNYLMTVGGDDTAFTASEIERLGNGKFATAHVPKTIDNDLPLPGSISTFGHQTARAVGVEIVQNIMEDAKTTGRWYLVVAMGRSAGHLALGIGKAAGATLTIIPEQFRDRTVTVQEVCDLVESSVVKRLSMGRDYGVAILAEGLASRFTEEELKQYGNVERDDHGNIRLGEIDLGRVVKERVKANLKSRNIKMTVVTKDLGYELRCADPIPFDSEYTRDLGYGAVRFLLNGGTGAMISIQGGHVVPIPFRDILDPKTHKTRVREVDVTGESYAVARDYMICLNQSDFDDTDCLEQIASAANMSSDAFRDRFSYLVGSAQAEAAESAAVGSDS